MSNIELKIKATKTNAYFNKTLPQLNLLKNLTRYQFVEILVRIAEEKYIKL